MKKAKKLPKSWKLTFHKGQYLKPSNINLVSVSEDLRKILWNLLIQLIQFTDQQIWLKNQQTVKKKSYYMLVLNSFQYKQCLCILTLPKYNQ